MVIDAIQGYACVFDRWSKPINDGTGDFLELIKPNAFDLLCSGAVYIDVIHAGAVRFAGTGNGSLRIWQDTHGLAFEADIAADVCGAGVRDMLAREPMQASFGVVEPVATATRVDGMPARIIRRLMIDHISICPEGSVVTQFAKFVD